MPIPDDIMDHEVIGRERRRGQREVILALMAERIGPVPAWAKERLESLGDAERNQVALRILKADSLEDLLA